MNILLCAYACEPHKGSEPAVGWNWAVNLARKCSVTVITRANNKDVIEKELLKIPQIKSISFLFYDIPIFSKLKKYLPFGTKIYYVLWQYSLVNRFRSLIDGTYDYIHHVTFNSISLPLFLYRLNAKLVLGPLGGGQCTNIKFLLSFRHKIIFELLRTIFVKMIKFNFPMRKNLKKASRIFVINEETKEILSKLTQHQITKLIETAIPESFIDSVPCREKKYIKPIKLLWIGALEPHKGLIILLKSLEKIKSEYFLTIVGDGSFKKYYLNYTLRNKLQSKTRFVGTVSYSDILNYYRDSDVFCFTSVRDSSGNVVIEAMSQSLPIICFNHQGVKEIVTDECGIKIDPKDKSVENKIAEAVDFLANDFEERIKMGERARKRVISDFSWQKKIEKIYPELLSENPSGS